jgi:hypothetical protein
VRERLSRVEGDDGRFGPLHVVPQGGECHRRQQGQEVGRLLEEERLVLSVSPYPPRFAAQDDRVSRPPANVLDFEVLELGLGLFLARSLLLWLWLCLRLLLQLVRLTIVLTMQRAGVPPLPPSESELPQHVPDGRRPVEPAQLLLELLQRQLLDADPLPLHKVNVRVLPKGRGLFALVLERLQVEGRQRRADVEELGLHVGDRRVGLPPPGVRVVGPEREQEGEGGDEGPHGVGVVQDFVVRNVGRVQEGHVNGAADEGGEDRLEQGAS